ncbi:type II toxin-antitoxin system PemK/MazF family toxin [Galactobacillus timonensis]|uniref:type II toxin-antitoxin system PemK/MazF family toxin n=1 Tax=Galactobacillus timonensis TaxID=2041840 RepID=UPI000C829F68|nr:type II toxin-antitoxin system PemK/MazF family toxin [Galactobacillus timonensis]
MKIEREFHQGDVYLARLGCPYGSEQGGIRPVIVLQNDAGCIYSPTVTMVPLTGTIKKQHLPSHYVLQDARFLRKRSMVLGEQIDTIDKGRMISYLGTLSKRDLEATAEAVKEHLGFYVPECAEAP